jgi:hypothetical protein
MDFMLSPLAIAKTARFDKNAQSGAQQKGEYRLFPESGHDHNGGTIEKRSGGAEKPGFSFHLPWLGICRKKPGFREPHWYYNGAGILGWITD